MTTLRDCPACRKPVKLIVAVGEVWVHCHGCGIGGGMQSDTPTGRQKALDAWNALPRVDDAPRWIALDKTAPVTGVPVLIYGETWKTARIGSWDHYDRVFYGYDNVIIGDEENPITHWMPLPRPPGGAP